MTAAMVGLICIAGGVGATLRFIADSTIRRHVAWTYPVATFLINFSGSVLLGLLTGLAAAHTLPHSWQLLIGTGLLGGYTTFSTASFETIRLIEDRRYLPAAINGIGMLIACTAGAGAGYAAGLAL
jgi:fluoride exporter